MYLSPICLQKEKEAHTEAQERGRLEVELQEQRRLIDALSAEAMVLREEVTVLQVRPDHPTAGSVANCRLKTSLLIAPDQTAAAVG